MERVGTLIDKLKEQFIQEAEMADLLATTQLLLAELQLQQKSQIPKIASNVRSKKDDLAGWLFDFAEEIKNTEIVPAISVVPNLSVEIETPEVPENQNELVNQASNIVEPTNEEQAIDNDLVTPTIQETSSIIDFTEALESPKLTVIPDNDLLSKSIYLPEVPNHNIQEPSPIAKAPIKEVFELNDVLHEALPSLNDQLKPNNMALSDIFHKEAIADLNKAIVLNDRYIFINELFRGDEVMYERSLKTINGFSTLLEAQSWIQRELKVKLGWNESSLIADQFDQLINRRFSSI